MEEGSMKIALIGAAGVRTPLILEAFIRRQERLGLDELALMDIDEARLDLIGALTRPTEMSGKIAFNLTRTSQAEAALEGADFVITTFRVGGMESRVIDERVPLGEGILGQETTGPGGFAMGMRTIPVLLDYAAQMRELCPQAWLINFANPAGMLTEALYQTGWKRVVGICDAPSGMQRAAAALLDVTPQDVFLDYFGLNHLGWVRGVKVQERDFLPQFIELIRGGGSLPGLPFDRDLIGSLNMIPNEYNFYYYYRDLAVKNILEAGLTRGEEIVGLNQVLYSDLQELMEAGKLDQMTARYHTYLSRRGETYMAKETGSLHETGLDAKLAQALGGEGYAGVALDLIEGLAGIQSQNMIVNIPNQSAIEGMQPEDVVEIPARVSAGAVEPIPVGKIPQHPLALMKQVKAYEQMTIAAALEGSYEKAQMALTIHPLVMDHGKAGRILNGYIEKHGSFFPVLK
jgi:6-phospho-beta-glucosidase